jgi:hypothetical protein
VWAAAHLHECYEEVCSKSNSGWAGPYFSSVALPSEHNTESNISTEKKNPNSTARSNGSHPSMTPCGNSGHCISSSARQKKLARPHISQKTECGNMPVIPAMWEAEVRGLRPY